MINLIFQTDAEVNIKVKKLVQCQIVSIAWNHQEGVVI